MLKKLFLYMGLLLCVCNAHSQEIPPRPTTFVNDYTGTALSEANKQLLEKKLGGYYDSTSTQIAVVLVKSVGSYPINDYAMKLGQEWGVGQKGKNNGVVILVATEDKKISIQTGWGTEASVSDAATQKIITTDLTPHFKNNDFYGGLDAATDDIITLMRGEFRNDQNRQQAQQQAQQQPGDDQDNDSPWGFIIVAGIVIVILVVVLRNRGGGGGGHIIGSRGGASPFWWFLGGSLLGSSLGGWGGFSNGGGQSDNGGSWGGVGDDGGSFGGDWGGGDFGGGGSSGSW